MNSRFSHNGNPVLYRQGRDHAGRRKGNMNGANKEVLLGVLSALLICSFSSGCATIINTPYQTVVITSTPPGAHFKVERLTLTGPVLVSEGETPSSVRLYRNDHYFVATLSQQGYEPAEVPIEVSKLSALVWIEVFLPPGFIGIIVDALTGSATILEPEDVNVTLVELQPTQAVGKSPVPSS